MGLLDDRDYNPFANGYGFGPVLYPSPLQGGDMARGFVSLPAGEDSAQNTTGVGMQQAPAGQDGYRNGSELSPASRIAATFQDIDDMKQASRRERASQISPANIGTAAVQGLSLGWRDELAGVGDSLSDRIQEAYPLQLTRQRILASRYDEKHPLRAMALRAMGWDLLPHNEIAAAAGAISHAAQNLIDDVPTYVATERDNYNRYRKENPKTAFAAEAAGALIPSLIPLVPGIRVAAGASKLAVLGADVARGALDGAAHGVIHGVGESDTNDLNTILYEASKGALSGAAQGAVFAPITKPIKNAAVRQFRAFGFGKPMSPLEQLLNRNAQEGYGSD